MWNEPLFDCIASFEVKESSLERYESLRRAVPRRVTALFIAMLEGLTQRQGLLSRRLVVSCSFCRRTRTHYLPVGLPPCTEGHSPKGHFSLR